MAGRQPPPPDVSEDANGARDPGSNPPSPPPQEPEGAVGGRRDDNSISFRHFLQPQSDVVPTRHHRSPRNVPGNPVDLVDIPIGGLPDFVQDHLIAEAHGDGLAQPDLPHFVPPSVPAPSSQPRPHPGVINPEDLGAHALNPSPAQNHTSSLPDFLSDGPMYYDASNMDLPSGSSGNGTSRGTCETRSEAHLRASSFDSDSLVSQNERLRREVLERSRMVSYYEAQAAQQGDVIGELRQALAAATTDLAQRDERLAAAETEIARLSRQLARFQNGDGDSGASTSSRLPNGPINTQSSPASSSSARVSEIANVTEDLLRQLLDSVSQLRLAALAALPNPDPQAPGAAGGSDGGDGDGNESERKES